jgi:type VI protein secretion system component VasA
MQPAMPKELAWRLMARSLPEIRNLSDVRNAGAVASAVQPLRELLKLLARHADPLIGAMASTFVNVQLRRISGIHRRHMVCHGLEIEVTLNDDKSVKGGLFLFAEVLRRLLARYATEHTFVKYRVSTIAGKDFGQWPITEGERFTV